MKLIFSLAILLASHSLGFAQGTYRLTIKTGASYDIIGVKSIETTRINYQTPNGIISIPLINLPEVELQKRASEIKTAERSVQQRLARVSADDLQNAYIQNEIAADQKYKNRTIETFGVITDFGTDITGMPYIIVNRYEDKMGVRFGFSKNDAGALARLSKRDGILISGVVAGKLMTVQVDDCHILEVRSSSNH